MPYWYRPIVNSDLIGEKLTVQLPGFPGGKRNRRTRAERAKPNPRKRLVRGIPRINLEVEGIPVLVEESELRRITDRASGDSDKHRKVRKVSTLGRITRNCIGRLFREGTRFRRRPVLDRRRGGTSCGGDIEERVRPLKMRQTYRREMI